MRIITKLPARAFSAFALLGALQLSGCGSPEERATAYLEQGKKFLAEHDNDRAGVQLRNAVKIKKDLVEAWEGLAQIEESKQQWPAYVGILRTILEIAPSNVNDRVKLTRILLTGGAGDEALKVIEEAYELNKQDAAVLALKAAVLSKRDDRDGAVRDAEAARAIDPANSEAAIVLAAERMKAKDSEGALGILNDVALAQTKNIGIDLFKFSIYAQTGKLDKAESLLLELVEKYPERAAAFRQQLTRFYLDQNRKDDAERQLLAVTTADPKNVQAALDYIRFLYTYRTPEAARQQLEGRADGRIPGGADVFPFKMALADFDLVQGRTADAIALLGALGKGPGTKENMVAAQMKLAELYVGQKKIDSASAIVSDVLTQDRRNVAALRLRALIRMERGEIEAAIGDLREAINDQSQSPDLLLQLASAYERSGNIELAEKQFTDATRISNFNSGVGLSYVGFLRRRGSAQRAEDILTELLTRNPNDIPVMATLAELRLARQDWAGAQQIADALRKLGNDRGLADQISGAALIGGNKLDESIGILQRGYDADPANQQPMIALVSAMARAKKFDQAIDVLQSVLKSNPGSAQALAALGAIYLAKNQPDQAARNFQAAIEKQPQSPVGYRAMAEMYIGQNKYDEAVRVLKSGIQAQPDSAVLRLALANLFEAKGDYEAAISEYKYLMDNQQGSLIVINNLASNLAEHRTDRGSLEQALTLAAALRKSPVPQFKDTLGWVSYQNGKYNDAIPLLEEAARELPNAAAVLYHLGMSYLSVGQLDKATKQFRVALAQNPDSDIRAKIEAAIKKSGG